jgi:hypothetical protein
MKPPSNVPYVCERVGKVNRGEEGKVSAVRRREGEGGEK